MRTAVDTSVLLDVLGGDPAFGPASRESLRTAYDAGTLLASDIVWAEVRAHFPNGPAFSQAVDDLGLEFSPLVPDAAALAGHLWRDYRQSLRRQRGGASRLTGRRVVPDFLVGAHALLQADALLSRDRGFYRTYFRKLRVIEPSVV